MTHAARILLISDATGSTLLATIRAALSQFPDTVPEVTLHPFIRRKQDLYEIPDAAFEEVALVLFTLVQPELKVQVQARAAAARAECLSLLDPVTAALSRVLGRVPEGRPGGQYRVDQSYLNQISAIDFAITHDDGHSVDRLLSADVVLVGVSRTSKTPTCIYLGYQGIKAANVPLLPDCKAYPALEEAFAAGVPVIGLTASPTRLAQIRSTRLKSLGSNPETDYTQPTQIEEELVQARFLFEKLDLPVIDVTRRSIEETAAEIRRILADRGERA